jgi:dethiobiotin synthetase
MLRGLFVTGTDTGVGKTIVSAALMHRYRTVVPLRYWKPIQTGIEQDDDTADVERLGRCSAGEIRRTGIRLPRPVSPHLAARLHGTTIAVGPLIESMVRRDPVAPGCRPGPVDTASLAGPKGPALRDGEVQAVLKPEPTHGGTIRWIVEGAGGVLVPINDTEMMIDLMSGLGLPVVVVARSALGTINHTLLTLEALRRRALRVAGVVMIGDRNADNRTAIERHGNVPVLGEMPRLTPLDAAAIAAWAATGLDPDHCLFQWLQ